MQKQETERWIDQPLAKLSISLPEISLHQIPNTDFKPTIKTEVRKKWERSWSSIRPYQNRLRAIKDTTKDWNPCYPGRRWLEIIMTRLRIGLMSVNAEQCIDTTLLHSEEDILCECSQYKPSKTHIFPTNLPSLPDFLGERCQTQAMIDFLTITQTIQNI